MFNPKRKFSVLFRLISCLLLLNFTATTIVPPAILSASTVLQSEINLPLPGTILKITEGFQPAKLQGISLHPENPLEFDFIIAKGDSGLDPEQFSEETKRLVKYFLAALTVPEGELWVNLSPYEQDKIIARSFGQTEMGRDLLAQDYILKQLTSSMLYPEDQFGKDFWDRVYKKMQEKFGTTDFPMNTFNKIWIVPDTATIYHKGNTAFILESRLKVMLEEDYVALNANSNDPRFSMAQNQGRDNEVISGVSSEMVREILLPEIEREVNEGEHFAQLRQVYHSLLLATWYKMNLKESLLGQVYVDKGKTRGIETKDREINQKIYEQYLTMFREGVFDYIKEDVDPVSHNTVPRRYFSGGNDMRAVTGVVRQGYVDADQPVDFAVLNRIRPAVEKAAGAEYVLSTVQLFDVGQKAVPGYVEKIQIKAFTDNAVLSAKAQTYQAVTELFLDARSWNQIESEVKKHVAFNHLGIDGQEQWFRNHFTDWVNGNLAGEQNRELRTRLIENFNQFIDDVNVYKLSVNQAYPYDLGFLNVAREYVFKLNEWERLSGRTYTVAEQIVNFSNDTELVELIKPLIDGKLPVFADVVLESLIPALAREGNDPNAQVAQGAGGLGFLDGETIAGVKKYLKGRWGSTDGYAGISALPLYEVFQRRTIAAKEIDWDNQQDIKPLMITDEHGVQKPFTFKVNFKGKIHESPRMIHQRNDLQKKLKLSAGQVNKFWDKLKEMGILTEINKRGQINDNYAQVLQASDEDFDGYQQQIWELLDSIRAAEHPAGKDYEVQVYVVNNEGTPQFALRAPKFDIFHHLYPGGDAQWIQYGFYGKAYVQLLKELGVVPDIIMLNEGQTFFTAMEMVNEINRAKLFGGKSMFEKVKIVYKTHTPNPAALPIYEDVARLRSMLGWDLVPDDLLTEMYGSRQFYAPKALANLSDLIIGVSDENARVARRIIVPGYDVEGVQNGSLPDDWYPGELAELVAERGYENISGEELYEIRRKAKLALNRNLQDLLGGILGEENVPQFADLENRPLVGLLRRMVRYKGQGMLIPLIEWIVGDTDKQYYNSEGELLGYGQGANLLLGGEAQDEYGEEWVARFKRMEAGAFTKEDLQEAGKIPDEQIDSIWERLKRDGLIKERFGAAVAADHWEFLNDADHEIVVSGMTKVSVRERYFGQGENLYRLFIRFNALKGKVIYIEKTGKNVMKAATTAVDLWLNMPDPTQEASGTSHQRVGLSGGLNIGVKGAGFDIQINHGVNGWLIDAFPEKSTDELIDMFNIGVRGEFRSKVVANMQTYWKNAQPLLRDYIEEAVQQYRSYSDSIGAEQVNRQWIDKLQSSFVQTHQTVTIEHNNIRNKMAFDAAMDNSGAEGLRRRKTLGRDVLTGLGELTDSLAALSRNDRALSHDFDLISRYVTGRGSMAVPGIYQELEGLLQQSRGVVLAALDEIGISAEQAQVLIAEELQVNVNYRSLADAAVLGENPDTLKADQALTVTAKEQKYGGIDLNPKLLDLQIRRDDTGVPLPLWDQPLEQMNIEGFVPVIINIIPLTNLPFLSEGDSPQKGTEDPMVKDHLTNIRKKV
ncbi:MAG: hypothetical protein AB7S78_12375 [Candidatus Omnitrophota bacterium]